MSVPSETVSLGGADTFGEGAKTPCGTSIEEPSREDVTPRAPRETAVTREVPIEVRRYLSNASSAVSSFSAESKIASA